MQTEVENMAGFERNTTGFTADVEMYDDGTLAKIYRDEVPDEDVKREILCTEFVQNKGLDVPEYRGAVTYNGKRAILLEYIRGESAMKELTSGDAEPESWAGTLRIYTIKYTNAPQRGLSREKNGLQSSFVCRSTALAPILWSAACGSLTACRRWTGFATMIFTRAI